MLLLGLTGALAFACAKGPAISSYRVQLPVLTAPPTEIPCVIAGARTRCLLIEKRDYESLIRELKGVCLANGQTPQECQAN